MDALSCPCGIRVQQPWRLRDQLWSPASFVGGLIWSVLGIGATVGGYSPFGPIVLLVLGALVLGSLALQAAHGHRRTCLLRRGSWFALAVPGLPLRILSILNF